MQYLLMLYFLSVAIMFIISSYHHYYNKIEFLEILIKQDILGLKLSEFVANYFYIIEIAIVLLSLLSVVLIWLQLYAIPLIATGILFVIFLSFFVYLMIVFVFTDYRDDCGCFSFKFMLDYKHLWFNIMLIVIDVVVFLKIFWEVVR